MTLSDETSNLILEYMRRVHTRLEQVASDMRDMKGRMTGVEMQLVRINRRPDLVER